jgi:FtsH-binding integral membrane protein
MVNSSIYNTLFGSKRGGAKSDISDLMNLIVSKKEFFILIFANLITQLGITYYIMEKTPVSDKNALNFWVLFGIQIIIIFVLTLVPMPSWMKFILFCVFSYTFGLVLANLKSKYDPTMIKSAIMGTISIFGVMMAFGAFLILSGIKLGLQFGLALLFALLLLIIVRIVYLFIPSSSGMKRNITIFSLMLFSVYIIYDTNSILQRNYFGDFITASLDYYLDILNIFVNMLSYNNSTS